MNPPTNSESCPTKPTDKRNYRNDGLHPTGIKCDPYTQTIKGVVKNGAVINAEGTTADGSDAPASSPVADGVAGCGACN